MATLSYKELLYTTLGNSRVHLRVLGTHKCNRQLQFRFYLYCSTIRVQFECTNIEQNVKILFMQCYGRKLTEFILTLFHLTLWQVPVTYTIWKGHREFLKS